MKCEDKVKFSSYKQADRVRKIRNFKKRRRIYLCPICHFWHLTSKPRSYEHDKK